MEHFCAVAPQYIGKAYLCPDFEPGKTRRKAESQQRSRRWQEVVENYWPEFMAFFFPKLEAKIDWSLGFEFLEQQWRSVVRYGEWGERLADKLVRQYEYGGEEIWILVHIEGQGEDSESFASKVFRYHGRIFERCQHHFVSLAVLGDENPTWRPSEFSYSLLDTGVYFRFPMVKLLDLGQDWEALEQSNNPFAIVVMTHLKANQTQEDLNQRSREKIKLTRRLYEKGYQRQDVINLFQFIDGYMTLPDELEEEFWLEVAHLEKERQMPYLTSLGRMRWEQEEATLMVRQLNRRIGEISANLEAVIPTLSREQLENLGNDLLDFEGEDDLRRWLGG
jgi:hypothetical protein